MGDLEADIQSVLNDPEQMAQIIQMAESLGLRPQEAAQSDPAEIKTPPIESGRQTALLRAILPYLPPDKQRRLKRAIEIGNLSKIAGLAMLQSQETE